MATSDFKIGDKVVYPSHGIGEIVGEEIQTIEDVYEPYLIQIGFLARTPRGRVVTPLGYKHLDITLPSDYQEALV